MNMYRQREPDERELFMLLFGAVLLVLALLVGSKAIGAEDQPVVALKFLWTNKNESASGSCFAVSQTQVLTARHCLYDEGKRRDCSVIVSGVKYPAELVREDAELDLALCEVKGVLLNTTPIELRPLNTMTFEGFPEGKFRSYIAKPGREYWKGSAMNLALVRFDHGMSGCPVVSFDSVKVVIVGMAVAGIPKDGDLDKGKALYLPAAVLLWFLNQK